MGIISDIFSNLAEVKSLYNKNGPWVMYEALSLLNLDLFGFGIPDILTGTCAICVALNNFYFHNNKEKLPKPLYETKNIKTGHIHEKCRCSLTKISQPKNANIKPPLPLRKFTEYIFNDNSNKNKGKKISF